MDEKEVRRQVSRGLRNYGYHPLTQDGATRIKFDVGRPDSIVIHPLDRSVVVEYKVLYLEREKSFAFNGVNTGQRNWQERWYSDSGLGYIGLGIIDRPKRYQKLIDFFLIDWQYWMITEERCKEAGSSSIPYIWHNRARVDLEITSEFKAFRMYKSDGKWTLPPYHSAIP